jgi:matrixin
MRRALALVACVTIRLSTSVVLATLAIGTAATSASAVPASPVGATQQGTGAASKFVTVGPFRILDTRVSPGLPVPANTTITVQVRGVDGVPNGATAVAATLVATEASAPGFVTVWGDGERPTTSALNIDAVAQTRANFAIIPLAADGTIKIYAQASTHLVMDISGVFIPAATATAGRFVPLGPIRLFDTRETGTPYVPGEQRNIDTTAAGVPVTASAVAITITVIGPLGWVAAWRAGTNYPGTSVLNVPAGMNPVSSTAIVPLTEANMSMLVMAGGNAIVDVTGYFTGAAAENSATGLFVATTPTRLLDTRTSGGITPGDGSTVEGGNYPFILANGAAIVTNVTATEILHPGFLTAYPARTSRPLAATANVIPGQSVATGGITPSSSAGIAVFVLGATHIVIDTTGYFTGTTLPAVLPPPAVGSYSFLYTSAGGYARWDPCRVIIVHVNYANAPAFARTDVAGAVVQLRAATGLEIVVGEDTDLRQLPADGSRSILIKWELLANDPLLAGSLGRGGGFWSGNAGTATVMAGWVTLKADYAWQAGFDRANSSGASEGIVLLHELGHAIGLGHVDDRTQVMNPIIYGDLGAYQSGDLAGLYMLGAAQGCIATDSVKTESFDGPPSVPELTLTTEWSD